MQPLLALKTKTFEKATTDPVRAQQKVLFDILTRNRKTEYGLKYGFSRIKSMNEYQSFVPLNNYESLRPYIDRMTKGEHRILTADTPVFFSITSGSTGRPKFVPSTKYSRSRKADVTSLWSYYLARDYPKIFEGKILVIVSPDIIGYTEAGIPYGAESGQGYKSLSPIVKRFYSLPCQVFDIENYDARYYTILRIAMEHNITIIATMTPSTIILLCQRIRTVQQSVIKDIERGTLDKSLDIPGNIRKVLENFLRPNPKRARELNEILEEKKELLPKYFWPNLQLIGCWKHGTVGLYLKEFPKYFDDIPVRDFGYSSSESRNSIPISDEGAGGVLAINANFYEFIPKEDIEKKEKRALLCDQLEEGKEYFIVLTTPGGLYRYNIDDMIRVDGFFNKTPVIEFVQKGLNVTSITGEKLYESQVVEALNKATNRHDLSVKFFTASIQLGELPRYAFLVEFNKELSRNRKKEFLRSIDRELCLLNEEYEFNRISQELHRPVLKIVSAGGFEKFREKRIQEGSHDSQFKVPQLTTNVDFYKNFDIEEEITMD